MDDLIAALQIFRKYTDDAYPTFCSHDTFSVVVSPDVVSDEDRVKLEQLGFFASSDNDGCFVSFRFGSC